MATLTTLLIPIATIVLVCGYLYLKAHAKQVHKEELKNSK